MADVIDLYTLSLGSHTLTVVATDFYGNPTTQSVTFSDSHSPEPEGQRISLLSGRQDQECGHP